MNLIFVKNVKTHICDVKKKNSRTGHDLPISVNDSDITNLRGFGFHDRICEVLRKLKSREQFGIYSM